MYAGGGCDHGVFAQGMRPAMDQAGIFAKARCVHGQDLRAAFQVRRSRPDFIRLQRILLAREFKVLLNPSKCYRREETLAQFQTL
jgi:hypothetical protein